jgi:integrase
MNSHQLDEPVSSDMPDIDPFCTGGSSPPRAPASATITDATPPTAGLRKRGPVAKRRFQKGRFEIVNNVAYSLFYEDVAQPNGLTLSRRARRTIGRVGNNGMSRRSALREHNAFMEAVNLKRGSVAPAAVGQTFQDITDKWRADVAPNLSSSTVRQRESHLRHHIIPRFGKEAPHTLTVPVLQVFATELRRKVSRKTVVQLLVTIAGIQKYGVKSGVRATVVSLKDLEIGKESATARRPFFSKEQVTAIIAESKEPYRTMFTLAWSTGLRAGELLALTVDDLDFARRSIAVNKSADDNTRTIGQTKTATSTALLPMPSTLATVLQAYLVKSWRTNPQRLLFPNRRGTHPMWRDNVVKYGLKPVLRKLKIPTKFAGLHAFRHGLATELADKSTPIPVMQQQMRHADVRTTLRVYAHVILQTQRDVMESISIGTVPVVEQQQTTKSSK